MGHADLEIGLEKSYISLKNVIMIMACIIKDGDKFYLQFLYCMSKKMLRILKILKKRINVCGVVFCTMMELVLTRRFLSFVSFLRFSCTTFWVQNVSIPPDQIVWIPQDQTVLIFFLSDLYIRNIETVLHRKA